MKYIRQLIAQHLKKGETVRTYNVELTVRRVRKVRIQGGALLEEKAEVGEARGTPMSSSIGSRNYAIA
ncbi:hypothetical protein CBW46_018280 [Paenibacillus xerothermodurans]|uniref:Uncharacterized protein n=1 Tax=Paenibacillus xerothermodurans TaxID=1977292 RepID=A0A2W1NIY5_PAEXE|nr:hypothetical protein CBW46_018280 [Paenibacillus xerothermodurans]